MPEVRSATTLELILFVSHEYNRSILDSP
ncbi:hypothetical protein ARTHRO8AJ_40184 [Arthrobacter sp. 8AJ]|nr:hypothetical protein ARTHRO8AJ_40184 [Arthrobacter sp. 8AJ]